MIAVWQGNEAWEVQHACKRVLLVGWTTPEEKSVARAEDEGERADRESWFLPVGANHRISNPGKVGKWEAGKRS
jgi:hypothetical protein